MLGSLRSLVRVLRVELCVHVGRPVALFQSSPPVCRLPSHEGALRSLSYEEASGVPCAFACAFCELCMPGGIMVGKEVRAAFERAWSFAPCAPFFAFNRPVAGMPPED